MSARKRLLVVSHPCVTALNQQFFCAAAKAGDFELELVVPARWRTEYARGLVPASTWDAARCEPRRVPVALAGNIPLHVYLTSFRRLIDRMRPAIAYVHHEPYALATAQLFAARPAWLPMGFYAAQNLRKAYPPPFAQFEQRVFREAAFAFPVTETVRDVLWAKGFRGPAPVLPLGYDGSLFSAEGDRQTFPTPTVGYLGRLVPEKGLSVLLEAFRRLPAEVGLAIIGNGPLAPQIEEFRNERPNVRWFPEVAHPEVPHYLRGLTLLALPSLTTPSWSEQFGRAIVEAAACKVPTIGSDSGEIPRMIELLGAGRVVPEGDPAALAEAITSALSSPEVLAAWQASGLRQAAAFENDHLARAFSHTLHACLEGRLQAGSRSLTTGLRP